MPWVNLVFCMCDWIFTRTVSTSLWRMRRAMRDLPRGQHLGRSRLHGRGAPPPGRAREDASHRLRGRALCSRSAARSSRDSRMCSRRTCCCVAPMPAARPVAGDGFPTGGVRLGAWRLCVDMRLNSSKGGLGPPAWRERKRKPALASQKNGQQRRRNRQRCPRTAPNPGFMVASSASRRLICNVLATRIQRLPRVRVSSRNDRSANHCR